MSWNYRVFEHWSITPQSLVQNGYPPFEQWFGLHEAYYDENGELNGYTDLITISSIELGDIEEQLKKMLEALKKPVITDKFDERPK